MSTITHFHLSGDIILPLVPMVYESWLVAQKSWVNCAIVITKVIEIISLALCLPYILQMALYDFSHIGADELPVFYVLACK